MLDATGERVGEFRRRPVRERIKAELVRIEEGVSTSATPCVVVSL